MTYVAAADRYDRMTYNRCGRSGLKLPAVSLGLWHNFGHDRAARHVARDRPPRVRPGRHPLRPGEQLRAAVRLRGGELRPPDAGGPAPVPRRARDLDEGRLRHVARPVRRVGVAQVPARQPRPEPAAARPRLRRHLLLAPLRSADAARGDDGRARCGCSCRQGAVRRHLLVLGGEDARGGGHPRPARHAAADPPAVVLDAQPLDRGRPARRARRPRRRLHHLLAARPGHADRPLPRRDPERLARGAAHVARSDDDQRGGAGPHPRAERDRGRPWTDARADGARLDAAGSARDVDAGRRQQRRAARSECRLHWTGSGSTDDELAAIEPHAVDGGINIWAESSRA